MSDTVSYPEGSREFTKLLGSGVGYGVVVGVGAFFAIAMSESSSRTRLLRASHVVGADGSSSSAQSSSPGSRPSSRASTLVPPTSSQRPRGASSPASSAAGASSPPRCLPFARADPPSPEQHRVGLDLVRLSICSATTSYFLNLFLPCRSATLLQSSASTYANGLSSAWWYGVGGSLQIALFAAVAAKVKQNGASLFSSAVARRRLVDARADTARRILVLDRARAPLTLVPPPLLVAPSPSPSSSFTRCAAPSPPCSFLENALASLSLLQLEEPLRSPRSSGRVTVGRATFSSPSTRSSAPISSRARSSWARQPPSTQ